MLDLLPSLLEVKPGLGAVFQRIPLGIPGGAPIIVAVEASLFRISSFLN